MARAAIGLGSNVGDRLENLRSAIRALAVDYSVTGVSSLYLTEPIGGPEQGEFLNAVALVETSDAPEMILRRLNQIEHDAGRVREERWGPRTLDLDLIAVRGITVASEQLTLPHPRAHLRRFVVAPLAEVWPDAQLEEGRAADHLRALVDQRAERLAEVWHEDRIEFLERGTVWVVSQAILLALFGSLVIVDGTWPRGWRWSGLSALALGAYLMLRAAAELGEALTPFPTPRHSRLAITGVYGRIRHPLYAGVVLLLFGLASLVGSVWAASATVAIAIFYWAKASYEEKRLRIVYPTYDEYRQRVPARFIPGLL
jgi:2-amino-4-hydroxy-6-hydroxymethyldihydropteridine diphosphokinase